MMRLLQKLVRNGNSTQVTFPRPMLIHAGLVLGDLIEIRELNGGWWAFRKFEKAELVIGPSPGVLADSPLEGLR